MLLCYAPAPNKRGIKRCFFLTSVCLSVFWIWLRPRYKIPEFFAIAPMLTSTLTVCGDPSSLYRTYRVRYKYYKKP